jgi:hypothetical protein
MIAEARHGVGGPAGDDRHHRLRQMKKYKNVVFPAFTAQKPCDIV